MADVTLRILGVCGSLRKASYNGGLLRVAQASAPEGVEIETFALNDIPLYNADVEAAGDPQPVRELKGRVAGADALLIATPEYNGSVPGLLKNTIDWLSRPPQNTCLRSKTVAIMGASAGRSGTLRAQGQLRQLLAIFGCRIMEEPVVAIEGARDRFDAGGDPLEGAIREEVAAFVSAFADWAVDMRSGESVASR